MDAKAFETAKDAIANLPYAANRGVIVEQAKAALPMLREATKPASRDSALEAMRMVALDRPVKGKSAEHWNAHKELFVKALEGYSHQALMEGAFDIIEDATILGYPRVADFKARVKLRHEALGVAAYRAKLIAEYVDPVVATPPTEEEKAKVAAMMAEVKASISPPRPKFETDEQKKQRVLDDLKRFEVRKT